MGSRRQQQRIAVGLGAHHELGSNNACASGPVIDNDLLRELFGEPLRISARNQIGAAAGGLRDDQSDRLRGIRLGEHAAGCERARDQSNPHSRRRFHANA